MHGWLRTDVCHCQFQRASRNSTKLFCCIHPLPRAASNAAWSRTSMRSAVQCGRCVLKKYRMSQNCHTRIQYSREITMSHVASVLLRALTALTTPVVAAEGAVFVVDASI